MTTVKAIVNIPAKWEHIVDNAVKMTGRDAFKYLQSQRDYIKIKIGTGVFRDAVDFNLEWQKGTELKLTIGQRRGYKAIEISFI